MVDKLLGCGQDHLFEHWPAPGEGDDDKRRFLAQAATCDAGYPGGVAKYVSNAKKLLSDSKLGVNPFDGWTPSVPTASSSSTPPRSTDRWRSSACARSARRRSSSSPAASASASGTAASRWSSVRARDGRVLLTAVRAQHPGAPEPRRGGDARAQEREGRGHPARDHDLGRHAPEDLDLLERNDYFGAKPSQVTLIKQEKVPCLTDNDARLALAADDPYKLQTKPHGHGDVHALLHTSGLLDRWSKAAGWWCSSRTPTRSCSASSPARSA